MDCDSAREAVSARIDGEASEVADVVLDDHLASCAACRGWQQRAHAMTRRARLGGAFLSHDLAPLVMAAVPAPAARSRRRAVQRGALLVLALAQLAIAAPMLILGHDREAGVHAAHELGSFNLALAVAFAAGAVRPKLSAGLAWPCAIAAAGLVVTALADLFSGQALGTDEAMHLVAVAGAALLAWQSRLPGVRSAAPALRRSAGGHGRPAPASETGVQRHSAPPEPPGGNAARLTAGGRDESVA